MQVSCVPASCKVWTLLQGSASVRPWQPLLDQQPGSGEGAGVSIETFQTQGLLGVPLAMQLEQPGWLSQELEGTQ